MVNARVVLVGPGKSQRTNMFVRYDNFFTRIDLFAEGGGSYIGYYFVHGKRVIVCIRNVIANGDLTTWDYLLLAGR